MPLPLAPLPTSAAALSTTVTLPKGAMAAPTTSAPLTVRRFREAASQTFDEGELVSLDSSGNVTNLGALADPTAGALSKYDTALDRATIATLVLGMTKTKASYKTAASTTANIEVTLCAGAKFLLRGVAFTADVTAANMEATRGTSEVRDVIPGLPKILGRYAGANIAATADTSVGRDCQTVFSITSTADVTKDRVRVVEHVDSTYGGPWAPTSSWPGCWVVVENGAATFGV